MPTWKRKRGLKIFLIERGFDFFYGNTKNFEGLSFF